MFRFSKTILVLALFSASTASVAVDNYKGIGRQVQVLIPWPVQEHLFQGSNFAVYFNN